MAKWPQAFELGPQAGSLASQDTTYSVGHATVAKGLVACTQSPGGAEQRRDDNEESWWRFTGKLAGVG